MQLEGIYTFDAPRDEVWTALMDPEILASIIPGCKKLEQVGQNDYQAVMKMRVGSVQGEFQAGIKISDIEAPEGYIIQVTGKGSSTCMKGKGQIRLAEQDTSTVMQYSGQAQIGGRIASVGQRLLKSSAKAIIQQSLDGLHEQVKAQVQAETEPLAGSVVSKSQSGTKPSSQVEFAISVAKNRFEDLVPKKQRHLVPEKQRPIFILGGVVVLFILFQWWLKFIFHQVGNKYQKYDVKEI